MKKLDLYKVADILNLYIKFPNKNDSEIFGRISSSLSTTNKLNPSYVFTSIMFYFLNKYKITLTDNIKSGII